MSKIVLMHVDRASKAAVALMIPCKPEALSCPFITGAALEKKDPASVVSKAADIVSRSTESHSSSLAAAGPSDTQAENAFKSSAAGQLMMEQAAEERNGSENAVTDVLPIETADGDAESPTHVFPLSSIAEETASQEREASRSTGKKKFPSESAAAGPSLLEDDDALDSALDAVLLAAKEEGKDQPDVPTFEAMRDLIPKPATLPLCPEGSGEEATAVANPAVRSKAEAESRHVSSPPALPTVPETEALTEPALPLSTGSKPADEDGSAIQSADEAIAGLSLAGIAPTKPLIDPETAADPEASHQLQAQMVHPEPTEPAKKGEASGEEEVKLADISTKVVIGTEEEHLPAAEVQAHNSAAQCGGVNDKELEPQSPDEPFQAAIFDSAAPSCAGRSSEQNSTGSEPSSPQVERKDVSSIQPCEKSQADGEAESSDEESYAVRPKVQDPGVFTSRLLAEYAAICTPVRSLPARQNGLQSSAAENLEESPKKVVKPLALSLAEPDDGPIEGSPVGDG